MSQSLCAAATGILLTLALPQVAQGFVRETVMGRPQVPLFWEDRSIILRPAPSTAGDDVGGPDGALSAVWASASSWQAVADRCSDLTLTVGNAPSGTGTNLVGEARDGENRIVWREQEWPDAADPQALAITTLIYRTADGGILDADIDINGVYWDWSTDGSAETNDLQNALTHELGHLLGLDHSEEPEATMWRASPAGEVEKRSLHEDDVAGLCFIYPRGAPSPTETGLLPVGLTGETACAATAPGATPSGSPAWSVGLALSLVLLARRLGSRRRRAMPARA